MRPANDWWRGSLRIMLPLAPLLAVATPLHAQSFTDPAGLADTAEPGSVLVFPKFAQGLITLDNGATEPNTQIEIAAVCPQTVPPGTSGVEASPQTCTPASYELEVHWVCPGVTLGQNISVCPETDFQVFVSTYGKVAFNPNGAPSGITANGRITGYPALNGTAPVPAPPCPRGYAIAYVVDSQLRPIARNVLIGDAVQRNNFTGTTNNDLQSYSALTIQAVLPNPPVPNPAGAIDGGLIAVGGDPDGPSGSTNASLPFDGWDQVQLAGPAGTRFIDTNLNSVAMGTPNGVVVSGQAFNVRTGGFRTLLGLIQTAEGPMGGTAASVRSYTVQPSNNSIPVPTYFVY